MIRTLVIIGASLVVILCIVLSRTGSDAGASTPKPAPAPAQTCLDEQHICNDGDSCCEGLACLRILGRSQKACMKTWDCETDSCYVNQQKDYVCSNGQNTCMSYPIQNDSGDVNVYCMDRGNAFRYIPPICKQLAQPNVFPSPKTASVLL
jgi:hypothetical protein